MTEAPEQAAVASEEKDSYLYEEEYQPWFVWMLILAPCFMPAVWYVPDRTRNVSQRRLSVQSTHCELGLHANAGSRVHEYICAGWKRFATTNLIVLASVSWKCPFSHPTSLILNNGTGNTMYVSPTKR
jgi:hypothetical protein